MVRLWTFPRSIDRGLIEAPVPRTVPDSRDAFPRSIDRGLIEAWMPWWPSSRSPSFPRSIDRGLIEAEGSQVTLKVGYRFRDQLIAASLKLEDAALWHGGGERVSAIN